MRQYAWYCPEIDVIVLQTIMQDCLICFEWGYEDMCCEHYKLNGDPIANYLWLPLGEI